MKFLKLLTLQDTPFLVNMDNVTEIHQLREYTAIYFNYTEGETNAPCYIKVKDTLIDIEYLLNLDK